MAELIGAAVLILIQLAFHVASEIKRRKNRSIYGESKWLNHR